MWYVPPHAARLGLPAALRRPRTLPTATLSSILLAGLAGCLIEPDQHVDIVTARDLAGTYTGVLEGVSVSNAGTGDPQPSVIVDLDLLHEMSVRQTGALTLRIGSAIVPPLRAFVVGVGPVAINAEFVEFEGLDLGADPAFQALKVKQIVFVKYEGEWVLVLQAVRVDVEPRDGDDVYVYQYVSYPSGVAEQMSRDDAIRYVNMILRLASAAQR